MERAGIMGAYKCGVPIRQIALSLGWSRTTVHDTIKKADLRENHASLSRPGRPRKLTDRQKREIIRQVRLNPTKTKKAILENLAFPIGTRAFNNVLKEAGLEGMTGQKIFYPKEPEKKQRRRREYQESQLPQKPQEPEVIDIDGDGEGENEDEDIELSPHI